MPKLFLFHPVCEAAIANGSPYYQAPQILRDFERDLDLLPAFFASPNDFLIVHRKLSPAFKDYFSELSSLPNLILLQELPRQKAFFSSFESWCISPMLLKKWKQNADIFADDYINYLRMHESHLVELHSKHTALNYCKQLSAKEIDFILPLEDTAQNLRSIPEVENFLKRYGQIVLKAPISSSGRGIQVIRRRDLAPNHYQWMQMVLRQQGLILAEKLFDNKLNIGAQFFVENGAASFLGFSHFATNSNGAYQANYLNSAIKDFVPDFKIEQLNIWVKELTKVLNNSIYVKYYRNFMNVDAMIYRSEQGTLKLHPFMELNCRYTMGTLELRLEKIIHPESKGKFAIFFQKGKDFQAFSREMNEKYPPIYEENKPFEGYFPLVEATKEKRFGAYMLLV